jgi:preprotein translocase SecE subunit
MAGFGQYLKDTRSELNHVAWPTQMQTIVYTILVLAVSAAVAAYLGIFDYLFTGTVTRLVENAPAQQSAMQTTPLVPDVSVDTEGGKAIITPVTEPNAQ